VGSSSPRIYAVRGTVRSDTYDGALHIGPRPTFRGSPPTIELHLLGFDEDIYGEEVRVDFVKYLREVLPFKTSQALVEQMKEDVERAREALGDG
jgi:riboflavin kinase / FMN adenylyltransferase